MEDNAIRWSVCMKLFRPGGRREDDRPGVYRIRAFTAPGEPMPISRLRGVDPDGIIHIGKSVKLRRRIGQFRRAAEGHPASHKAGIEFHEWRFEELIPASKLYYDFAYADNEEEALALERSLHEEYRRTYLDRPPLDATSGQYD